MAKPETQGSGQALGAAAVEALSELRFLFHEHAEGRCNKSSVRRCPHCAMLAGSKQHIEDLRVVLQTLDDDDRTQKYRLACSAGCGFHTGWYGKVGYAMRAWDVLSGAVWRDKIRTAGKPDPQIAEPTLTPQADDPLGEAVRILKRLAGGAGGEKKTPAAGDDEIERLYRNFYLPEMARRIADKSKQQEKYPWIP